VQVEVAAEVLDDLIRPHAPEMLGEEAGIDGLDFRPPCLEVAQPCLGRALVVRPELFDLDDV
jgi:hypothetical protein